MKNVLPYLTKLRAFAGMKLYVYLFGMIVISLLQSIGLFLLIPMLGLIGLTGSGTSVPFASLLARRLDGLPDKWALAVVLVAFLLLLMAQVILQRAQAIWSEKLEQSFNRHLRVEIYESLLMADWPFFLRKRKSDFIHMMTSELPRVSYGIYLLLGLATTILFAAVQIGVAFWLSAELTVAILLCGALLALYSRRNVRKSEALGERASALSEQYFAGMTEHFNGIKDIKSNRMEDQHAAWFRTLNRELEENQVQFTRVQTASQISFKAVSGILLAGFVFASYSLFDVAPDRLVLIILLFSRLWPTFSGLQSSWEQLAQTLPAFKNLAALQQEVRTAKELELGDAAKDQPVLRISRGIECRGVSYRYDKQTPVYALRDINLQIAANSMTAIVGKSGAGKSTLIDILIGLLKPEQGEVLVDGQPLGKQDAAFFRGAVSYVSQDPFLFHATLRENLLIAAPGANEKMMWEALAFAAADEFVRKLPDGLDTVLGDRGVRLSGGERQRVVLARAMLRKPSILVLDEATSALDSENERTIQLALDRLKGMLTIIVIAHRLSTIRGADQVLVLENGAIVQQGGYQQLSGEREGVFGKLLRYQDVVNS
ncbi:ABC transporter ATP-binding protein [Gorillibacterium massiliense]|uniref:ABC transporter ATP-binding protein n=1 Tax=Gorillibacterium massiliense TaxID=1280390 RepID=UPI0004BBF015|nr:ABC transporter ATP-binding protein [Gorillibacterium massiliense]